MRAVFISAEIVGYILGVYVCPKTRGNAMQTARVFMNGNSQAVRLPKEFRFEDEEVVIKRVGHTILLIPKRYAFDDLKAMLQDIGPMDLVREQPGQVEERDFA
jgi:antitoxin VapB